MWITPPLLHKASSPGPRINPNGLLRLRLAHNYLLSPTVVNEVRVGVSDIRIFTSTDISAETSSRRSASTS